LVVTLLPAALPVDGGYAVVRPVTAASKVFAYASVVDNLTGDPTYVAARVER
jgi:hypothetical protein